jgi:subtilisin
MKLFWVISFALISMMVLASMSALAKQDNDKRVIAHSAEEVAAAFADGCSIVRETHGMTALLCPEGSATAATLQEDIRMYKTDASTNTQIRANLVHASNNTGAGRVIAVLDTGYNYNHPELASSYLGGKDFVNNDNDPLDDEGHGSHVAGIITADGIDPNAKGVAPSAGIIAAKVLDETGSGYFSDSVAAIYWVIDGADGVPASGDETQVDAISMSLGSAAPYLYKKTCDRVYPEMTAAINYARSKGVLVVVAAGNSGIAGVSLPGCISGATTVGAVDDVDKIASFSGRGKAVDITAPGVTIWSSVLNGYASYSGTSMATPAVSAVVALVKAAHPTFSAKQAEDALTKTAKDLGKRGKDTSFGWGRIDAQNAANYAG